MEDLTMKENDDFILKATNSSEESWTNLILNDFEVQCQKISEQKRQKLISKSSNLVLVLTLDFLLNSFLLGPLLIAFWRGTWDYVYYKVDDGLFKDQSCVLPNVLFLTVGLLVSFTLQLFQHDVLRLIGGPESGSFRHLHVSRTFSVVMGLFDIYFWKGLWDGINCAFGNTCTTASITLSIGAIFLLSAGCFRSIISSPLGTVLDNDVNCCQISSYLSTTSLDPLWLRAKDVLVSLICEANVILVWHGIWSLQDIYLYSVSNFNALIVGIFFATLAFLIQFPFARVFLSKDVHRALKFLCNFILTLISGFATITLFRAYWYLFDDHFLTVDKDVSRISGQLYGALGLMILHCSCSLQPGIIRDCPETKDGLFLPYFFASYFYISDMKCVNEEQSSIDNDIRLPDDPRKIKILV